MVFCVNDGQVESDPATTTVTTLNTKPEANAGSDQTVFAGSTVTLDGSKSTDVDGDLLTYRWSFTSRPAGSAAELSEPGAVKPTFQVDKAGAYVVQLIVNDGNVNSDPDTVVVTVLAPLRCSITALPVEGRVPLGVQFSSAVTGGLPPYGYSWSIESGQVVATGSSFNHTFENPGTFSVNLKVIDTLEREATATVSITALPANNSPVAKAGGPYRGTLTSAGLGLDPGDQAALWYYNESTDINEAPNHWSITAMRH